MKLDVKFSEKDCSFPTDFGEVQTAGDGGYERGLQEGRRAEYDRFWDAYQQNGNRTDYRQAFGNTNSVGYWTEDIFKPKYDLKPTTCEYMFAGCPVPNLEEALEKSGIVLDTSNCDNGYRMFTRTYTSVIPELDLRKGGNWGEVVAYSNVKIIRKIIFSDTPNANITSFFHGCGLLEEVRFEGVIPAYNINVSSCSNFSNESVQSIIDHLKDLTGATAQTLTFHATVGAAMTEEQKYEVRNKNWNLVY